MLILAVYYTIADMVLLGQMFYYRGFTWRDEVVPPAPKKKKQTSTARRNGAPPPPDERTRLLGGGGGGGDTLVSRSRRGSDWSDRLPHLNPANPVVETAAPPPPSSALQSAAWNTLCVVMVVAAGVLGWWLSQGGSSTSSEEKNPHHDDGNNNSGGGGDDGGELRMDLWGQIFGWLCAVFYLGSRLPQLLLNWRRKSTEGVSMLFFLFACLGNLTYVLSILAFEPKCAGGEEGGCAPGEAARMYGRYILVNLSWLAGSLGTFLLDMGIFIQFFVYAEREGDDSAILEEEGEDGDDERSIDDERWDQRPILERNQSGESH